jgi:hypothetical protein
MTKFLTLLAGYAFILNSCNPIKLTHNADKTTDFSNYKTYSFFGWAEGSGDNINEIDKKNLEKAFANEFNKHGLQLVKSNGDIIVSLFLQINEDYSTHAYIDHYNMGGYYGYYFAPTWGWGVQATNYNYDTQDYYKGTLVLDVFDQKTKKQIWQAVGSRRINENPEKREKNIPKIASLMLRSFPINKKK